MAYFFLPQLLGERENLGSPDAKGAFIGLSFDTDLAHLCRSLMEGVCYAERRILDAFTQSGMHFNALYSRGGGVNSRIWNQIRCDIYQHPIHVLEDADNSGLIGAALLAGKGVGLIQNMEQVAKKISTFEKRTTQTHHHKQPMLKCKKHIWLHTMHFFQLLSFLNTLI